MLGVDGIHYGRIRGYGDMVFAVNPMPAGEQHVRPLAGSFRDFLRLLLACGSTTTLEQAGDWTREQFDTYLRAPMEDPFSYIKGVQASFDGGKLHYTDEYYDTLGLARPDRREPASQGFEFETVVFALEKE